MVKGLSVSRAADLFHEAVKDPVLDAAGALKKLDPLFPALGCPLSPAATTASSSRIPPFPPPNPPCLPTTEAAEPEALVDTGSAQPIYTALVPGPLLFSAAASFPSSSDAAIASPVPCAIVGFGDDANDNNNNDNSSSNSSVIINNDNNNNNNIVSSSNKARTGRVAERKARMRKVRKARAKSARPVQSKPLGRAREKRA
eukprot:g28251.t1